MTGTTLRGSAQLAWSAVARLLVLLSASYLVYQIGLSESESAYHPLYRFWNYFAGLVTLRPGVTPDGVPASFYIRPALVRTVALFVGAVVSALGAGWALARWNFIRFRERAVRRLERLGSLAYALPVAVITMALFVFAAETGWFPLGGTASARFGSMGPVASALDLAHHYLLPWATLSLFPVLVLVGSGLQVVEELRFSEHVVAAKSHGFADRMLFRHHASRSVWARLLSDLASHLPLFITYLVIVELVFRYTGVGYYMVRPYSGFWGMRDEGAFVISQSALVYVGALSIVAQLSLRVLVLWLVPRSRAPGGPADQMSVSYPVAIGLVVCAGAAIAAFVGPVVAARASGSITAVAAAGAAACTIAVGVADRRTAGSQAVAACGLSIGKPIGVDRVPPLHRRVRVVDSVDIGTGRYVAAAVLVILVVLPWLLSEPKRPSAIIMVRPNALEHPQLIGYFFLHTLVRGRFLLVVLSIALAGAVAGTVLGTLAGYLQTPPVDRAIGYVAVIPSVLVAVLMAGVTRVVGLPLAIALFVAGTVRFHATTRRVADELRRSDVTGYAQVIGEGPLEQLLRHVGPNQLRHGIPNFLPLVVDLVVLTVNLSFLRLLPTRRVGSVQAPGETDGVLAVLTNEWGSLLADGRSHFVRGAYISSFWPIVLLIVTIALLRYVSAREERR